MLHIIKQDSDTHQICKALNILGTLAQTWSVVQYLYKTKIVKVNSILIQDYRLSKPY